MASRTVFHRVPSNVEEWRMYCKDAGVQRRSINSFVGMHSGSEMTQGQYLLMRVLYPRPKAAKAFNWATYGLTQDVQAAITFLNALPGFQNFLHAIRTNIVLPDTNLGIFAVPRINQLLIQPAASSHVTNNVQVQTINPPSRSRAATRAVAATTGQPQRRIIDEEVVNVHMITLLQALTYAIPNVSSEWSPYRFAFQTRFAIDKYEARTDGHLQVQGATGKIQAIVEVKRRLRRENMPSLEMQEAAEMVGWIMDNQHRPNPSLVGR
jgi:hypothetical protein